jgi:hypothetical protein
MKWISRIPSVRVGSQGIRASLIGPRGKRGFPPVKAGGLDQAIRIEMLGDLHDFGGLNGRLLTVGQARTLLTSTQV